MLQKDGILSILISCHQKILPNNTIRMLINSLVFSYYVLSSCLGPSLSVNLFHCIIRLHNRGVHMTFGLRKYYITDLLLVGSLLTCYNLVLLFCITHLLLCTSNSYRCNHCLLLNLQIKSGRQTSYHTRTPATCT